MTAAVRIEPLGSQHDRKAFACGVEALDRYFRELVTQDVKRRVSNCFVAVGQNGEIVGYYTFAATGVALGDLPSALAKKLPRYPLAPAALIGRLAISTNHQGRNIGGALVIDAVLRASRADPAVFAILVDAKDVRAAAFYEHLGFQRLASRPRSLFLPIATALKALDES
uniref:GNAT family N-acetyltransferase n=1 Tax=uncultured Rhizobium sp. TaxID=155567 RepID=UPI002630C87D|nr:GNAT family N-acetyltransferase [uncultured Rhizobium sp.]